MDGYWEFLSFLKLHSHDLQSYWSLHFSHEVILYQSLQQCQFSSTSISRFSPHPSSHSTLVCQLHSFSDFCLDFMFSVLFSLCLRYMTIPLTHITVITESLTPVNPLPLILPSLISYILSERIIRPSWFKKCCTEVTVLYIISPELT